MRPTRLITSLLLAAVLASPAAAQTKDAWDEPDILSDALTAQRDGYEILRLRDQHGTAARQFVDETFMSKIAAAADPGASYGFAFAMLDLTGDGVDDVILVPKMARLVPPSGYDRNMAATYVYVADGDSWHLAIEGGSMAIGVRKQAGGDGYEVALIQETGYLPFVWRNGEFQQVR